MLLRPWVCTRCGRRGLPRRRGCKACGAAFDAEFVGESGTLVQIIVSLVVFAGLGALLVWLGAGALRDLWNVLFGGESAYTGAWFWVAWALKLVVLIAIGALGVIALGGAALMIVIGVFGALSRNVQFDHRRGPPLRTPPGDGDDVAGGAELLLMLPIAIVSERLLVEPVPRAPELAPLTSEVAGGDLPLFIATLFPGTDALDDDERDEDRDESIEDDAEPDEGEDHPDDELAVDEHRVHTTLATATATLIGLAARGRVQLSVERVDRVVDPRNPSSARSPLVPRGTLVERVADADGDVAGEPALEQAVLAALPAGVAVRLDDLRDVLETLHVDAPPSAATDVRVLAEHLGSYLARHPAVWRDLLRVLERYRVVIE